MGSTIENILNGNKVKSNDQAVRKKESTTETKCVFSFLLIDNVICLGRRVEKYL